MIDVNITVIYKDDQQYLKKVGGWMISSKEDMYRVSPKWLSMTRSVRLCDNTIHCGTDDESKLKVWQKTGDQYITKTNPKPWISEMYGYVFGSGNDYYQFSSTIVLLVIAMSSHSNSFF